MSSIVDVVVIGAGLSGLTAAYTIIKDLPSANLVVLEASNGIGGPISSATLRSASGDDVWDIGAGRIGSKQNEIMGLISEFGLETFQHYDKGKKYWILIDGKVKKYSGKIPPLPYTGLLDLLMYFKKVDGMQGKVNLGDAKATPKAEEWDNMTVDELKNKTLWTQVAKETIDIMTGLFFGGLKCDQLSVMQYIYNIATCGSWNGHIAGEGTGRLDLRIKGGAQRLVNKLVESIGSDKILTAAKVNSIEHQIDGAVVTTDGGQVYTAKYVIVACVPTDLIKFSPPLSVPKLLPGLLHGAQFVITYHKSFWREAGSCAEVMNSEATMEMLNGKDDHPIVTLFDHTSANGNPALMGIMGPQSMKERSTEDRRQLVLKFLQDIFETDEVNNFVDYKDFVWNPIDNTPPPETLKENKPSEVLSNIRKPEGVIHWAGTRTATAWADSLNGAVDAGQRAGKEVLQAYSK